jgi:acyl-coenzyme A synthetase/AMP-(fatty) acid ligase
MSRDDTHKSQSVAFSGELPPQKFNMARYCLARSAERSPDKVALMVVSDPLAPLDEAENWTYSQLEDAVRRIAGGLQSAGLKKGDRLMIRLPNTSMYALLFFGALAAGIVPLPASTQLTNEEAEFLFVDCGARAIAIGSELTMDTGNALCLSETDVAALMQHAPIEEYVDTLADDPAYLVYTSGTSGKPKGVLHAHRAAWGRRPMYQGWYGMNENDIVLHAGAFNWTYTLGVGLTDPWANGATTVLYNGEKDVQVWPKLLETSKATLFAAVPSLYRQVLKYCDLSEFDLSHFRHGLTAGEALSETLLTNWRQATGTDLFEALGMSECSTYISTGPGMRIRVGSPGKPQPGRSIAVLNVEGANDPLDVGETGLLAIHRSDPGLMLHYWNRPEEDAAVTRGEWFVGGDLARFDADGYLWYEGRADDVMNAMGYRVSPLEVEVALTSHPNVAEVAVCELAVKADVSVIAAFIVPKDADEVDAASVLSHAAEHLAAYKRPREVMFVDQLPRSANGKILRRVLAETHSRTS